MGKNFLKTIIVLAIILRVSCDLAAAPIFIETVPVGDTNNLADPLTGYGAVENQFSIARTEVTALQYCAFLNAVAKHGDPYGLYNSKMGSDKNVASIYQVYDSTNRCYLYTAPGSTALFPVTYVSWLSAARFCNWLENDQPEGDEGAATTEQGAYDLNGFMGGVVPVAKNATWFLPTENQWYKAAYYKGGGSNAGYWLYPTRADAAPDNSIAAKWTNNANVYELKKIKNFWGNYINEETYSKSQAPYLTSVYAFTNSCGPYGTYDMGGNVFEWVDAERVGLASDVQVIRGGAWGKEFGVASMASTYRNTTNSLLLESSTIGFRVAMQKQKLKLSWVIVGDPGNPADPVTGHGAVNDTFKIGKYPITAEQFTLFLNSVAGNSDPYELYNQWMRDDMVDGLINCILFSGHFYYSVKPGRKNFPVNHVGWFHAARFCNWVHNGCPEGNEDESTTEAGAYALKGKTGGRILPPNENAQCYVPTQDQWYKAAYYDGNGGYNEYPTRSGLPPGNTIGGEGDQANYSNATKGTIYATSDLTPVNLFENTESHYGARDMGGNVWEWNSTDLNDREMIKVQARGSSFKRDVSVLAKENYGFFLPDANDTGFRVVAPVDLSCVEK